jgi:hypothetical protein
MTKAEFNARLGAIHDAYVRAEKETLARHAVEVGELRSRLRVAANDLRAEYNADA